jgi:hypothetical protein
LPGEAAPAHLSDLLRIGLSGEPASMAAFRGIGVPRYLGLETVNQSPKPVSAAVDAAFATIDGALLIVGWLLDPESRVASVSLSSSTGMSISLDDGWTRLARPDLLDGFATVPKFAGKLSDADVMHGFVAHVDGGGGSCDRERHLELRLNDGDLLFLPVSPTAFHETSLLSSACAGFLGDEIAMDAVVRQHLAPFMRGGRPKRPTDVKRRCSSIILGDQRRAAVADVVMPFDKIGDLMPVFAALDGAAEAEMLELTLVARRDVAARTIEPLRRAFAFHGLQGRLIASSTAMSASDSLDAGLAACEARYVVYWTPSVLPDARGWLARLLELAGSRNALVSPSLIYEDGSIFYGGSTCHEGPQTAQSSLLGYAPVWISGAEAAPCAVCAPDFCVAPRSLIERSGGLGGELYSGAFRHLDLSRRARRAGGAVLWEPSIRFWMLDDAPSSPSPFESMLRRVDEEILATFYAEDRA